MNAEQMLRSLEPVWPETPDIATAVAPRLAEAAAPARAPRRRLVLAVAVGALLLAGTAVAAIPPLREWVDELFGGRVEVRQVPKLPSAPAEPDLGPRLSLAAARARAGFDAPYPPGFVVFHARAGEFGATGGRRLFTAIRGALPFEFVEKLLGPGTRARVVRVGSTRGIWITGTPHVVIIRRPSGGIVEERLRLASNTLVWPRRGLVLRLEGAATLAEALRVAQGVR